MNADLVNILFNDTFNMLKINSTEPLKEWYEYISVLKNCGNRVIDRCGVILPSLVAGPAGRTGGHGAARAAGSGVSVARQRRAGSSHSPSAGLRVRGGRQRGGFRSGVGRTHEPRRHTGRRAGPPAVLAACCLLRARPTARRHARLRAADGTDAWNFRRWRHCGWERPGERGSGGGGRGGGAADRRTRTTVLRCMASARTGQGGPRRLH